MKNASHISNPGFVVYEPVHLSSPFIFNVPHAGRYYLPTFLQQSRLDEQTLRRLEDPFVDELFADVVDLGAPLMVAQFPRAFLDVNREPYELDTKLFEGHIPDFANTCSSKVTGGLGTLPRLVGENQNIYKHRVPISEAFLRIEHYYMPYHRCLETLVERSIQIFGHCILVDCHSMPSNAFQRHAVMKADIVLGDRHGTSCLPTLIQNLEAAWHFRELTTARNTPYAGGYITEHYGQPLHNCQAIQIEICRSLYMNESKLEKNDHFFDMKKAVFATIQEWCGMNDRQGVMAIAAE